MNKKLFSLITFFAVSGLILGTAFAQTEAQTGLRNKFQEVKGVYERTKTDYQTVREGFLKARQNARTPELKAAAVDKGKELAKKMADQLIQRAEVLKARVNEVKDLSDADKTLIISQIDSHIAAINTIKSKIDAAATNEELRSIVKDLRARLRTAQVFDKHFVGRLLAHRINKGIERVESVIQKAEAKIAEFKAAGKDAAKLENLTSEARSHLDLAKSEYQKAKDKYQEVATAEDFAKVAKEANRFAKEANRHLILAHKAVQRLIPETNKLIRPIKPVKTEAVTSTETATTATTTVEQTQ